MSQPRPRIGYPPTGYSHTLETLQYTLDRRTAIRMSMLGKETDHVAFFILDYDTPVEMINEVLKKVYEESGVYHLWLADDTAESLPDEPDLASVPPIAQSWQSAFTGQTIEQAFEFISNLPTDAEISIDRTYIVVLDTHLYRTKDWVMVCKIDTEGIITTAPCAASSPILHIHSYTGHLWPEYLDRWRREGTALL